MELRDEHGKLVTQYLLCMETKCIQCKKPVNVDDKIFTVLGTPYFGCLHKWCAPYFNYNGEWPHELPIAFYQQKKSASNVFDVLVVFCC